MVYLTFEDFMDLEHDKYYNQCLIIIYDNHEEYEYINEIIIKYNYDINKITII